MFCQCSFAGCAVVDGGGISHLYNKDLSLISQCVSPLLLGQFSLPWWPSCTLDNSRKRRKFRNYPEQEIPRGEFKAVQQPSMENNSSSNNNNAIKVPSRRTKVPLKPGHTLADWGRLCNSGNHPLKIQDMCDFQS